LSKSIKPTKKKPVDRATEKTRTRRVLRCPPVSPAVGQRGRSEGEGEKRRDRDGKGDCETKLFIYLSGMGKKATGRNTLPRTDMATTAPDNSRIRVQFARRHPLPGSCSDLLDYDNRVIDYQTSCQDDAK